jgi:nitrogen regulatory protein PII 2
VKEVIAFVRPERLNATRQAILNAGAEEVVQRRVLGRGKQRGLRYLRPGAAGAGEMLYMSKRMVVCWVPDETAPLVIDAIIATNQTGNVGDGKVFVRTVAAPTAAGAATAAAATA